MNIAELREVHRSRPFVAFEIHTTDGETFAIAHPENLALDEGSATAVCRTRRHSWAVVDLGQIASLQRPIRPKQKSKGK